MCSLTSVTPASIEKNSFILACVLARREKKYRLTRSGTGRKRSIPKLITSASPTSAVRITCAPETYLRTDVKLIHTHTHTYIYTHTLYTPIYVCVYIYVDIYTYIYIYLYTYLYYISLSIYLFIYLYYIYRCVYIIQGPSPS